MPPGVPPYKRKIDDGIEKPKSLREVPSYLKKVISGFFSRLFYIVSLVWEAAQLLFVAMVLFCILNGILPVVGAYISKDLLNVIAELIGAAALENVADNIFVVMEPLLWLFIFYFVHSFLSKMVSRLNTMVTGMAGELVVNHIKLKIVGKAKEVDLASFDRPEFYEKLENANREATMRPIHILSATFSVISTLISSISSGFTSLISTR
jgi:ATP-binding cassette subfamily B protein